MDTGFGGNHPWTLADIHLIPFLVYQNKEKGSKIKSFKVYKKENRSCERNSVLERLILQTATKLLLRAEHSKLILSVPGVVERERIDMEHVGPTTHAEVHTDNEAIFTLEEVAIFTELVLVLVREGQNLVIVLPAPAFLAKFPKYLFRWGIFDEFVGENFEAAESYHLKFLSHEKAFEVNLRIHDSLENISNHVGIARSIQKHLAYHEPKLGDAFPNIGFCFVSHNFLFLFDELSPVTHRYIPESLDTLQELLRYFSHTIIYLFY